jgi:hypothetical protein
MLYSVPLKVELEVDGLNEPDVVTTIVFTIRFQDVKFRNCS